VELVEIRALKETTAFLQHLHQLVAVKAVALIPTGATVVQVVALE
jgi:hypothetical protein